MTDPIFPRARYAPGCLRGIQPNSIEVTQDIAAATEATLRAAAPTEFDAWEKARTAVKLAQAGLRDAAPDDWEAYRNAKVRETEAANMPDSELQLYVDPTGFREGVKRELEATETALSQAAPLEFDVWKKTESAEAEALRRLRKTVPAAFAAYEAGAKLRG